MDEYVETTDDNGGVHLNSGIPNRAFHLAATAIGGRAWEGAGRIWYAALTGGQVGTDTDFAGFAAATVAAAGEHADAVRQAWETVGRHAGERLVHGRLRTSDPAATRPWSTCGVPVASPAASPRVRSTWPPTTPACRRSAALVERIDLSHVAGGNPHPDMFVYAFDLCGRRAQVPEQHLTPDLSRLAVIVLDTGDPRA